jgi:glutamate synthase (NADPH/NADH) small chain
MGKPTGFLEYLRELPVDRKAEQRIRDWQEFHLHMEEKKLREQGARCMDCGIPFCHTGQVLAGMASGCPINNLIPEWNDLVYRGLWREALERLHKTNNFPEFTGRVCPAPCEGACVLGINEPPVTIKNIECSIADRGWDEGWITPEPPEVRTGKKVAVVGSGPAGLSAAAQLNKAGHLVTVFERDDRIGGLLMYGIPNMKLDKKYVQRRVDLLTEEGVTFVTKTEVGKDITAQQLVADFDAVIVATGATKPNDLPIPGRQLGGVYMAMDFLRRNTQTVLDGSPAEGFISAEGKDVVVIGGGDTGTDCVGTSLRHRCHSLVQLEILPKPPQERTPDNPWPQWPKVYRLDYGQEEALAVFGSDPRVYRTTAKELIGDENGNVKEIVTVQVEAKRDPETGRFRFDEVPGTEKRSPAQLVVLALGFRGPEDLLVEQLGVERDERTNVKAAYGKYATSVPNVFACGDARRGQSLVVWAFNEGRGAARECDRYLMGSTDLP